MYRILTIPARYEALERITSFMDSLTTDAPPRLRSQLALAVHELCVNIIQHAYSGAPGEITLYAESNICNFYLSVYDTAPNIYKYTEHPPPDPLHLPESGWGLVILHRIMDEVIYDQYSEGSSWHLAKHWDR